MARASSAGVAVRVLREAYNAWDTETLHIDSSDGDVTRMQREVLAAAGISSTQGA